MQAHADGAFARAVDVEAALHRPGQGAARRGRPIAPDRLRPRRRARGVRAQPRGLACQRELPHERGDEEDRRHDAEQLCGRLTALAVLPWRVSSGHATTIPPIGFIAIITAAAAERFMRSRREEATELRAVHERLDEVLAKLDALERP